MRNRLFLRALLTSALVVANTAVGSAQESRAVFDAPLVVVPGDNRIEHLVDFDHDGYMDALSWWYTSNSYANIHVRGWRNDHTGALTLAWTTTFATGLSAPMPAHIAIGEVDGDGDVDFVISHSAKTRIYLSNGLLAPTLHETFVESEEVKDCALADMDGDGYAELLERLLSGTVKVYRNQGPGQSWTHVQSGATSLPVPLTPMRIGEVTGDGTRDVLLVYAHRIRIVPLDASCACQPVIEYPTVSSWVLPRPVIGDIDGDGDDDVVVWDGQGASGFYEMLRRVGPASFAFEAPRAGGPSTELADIDLDGDLDGICCGGGSGTFTWLNAGPSTFNICHNDGSGNFTPSFQMRGVGSTHIAGAADMDHDGDVDLVAGRVIYYARGTFAASPVSAFGGELACEQTLADFDGDGDRDLNFGLAGVQRSNGQTQFTSFVPMFPTPPAGAQFQGPGYPGDFDGDGDLDWIVARNDAGVFTCMELLENRGGGNFADGGPAGAPGVNFSYAGSQYLFSRGGLTADLDLDGDLDLVTRPLYPTPIGFSSRVWLNDGAGMFTLASTQAGAAIALGDLNGDQIPDLIARTIYSPSIAYWRLGLGDGTFDNNGYPFPGSYFDFGPRDEHIVVEDIDADGDLDVAATNASTNFSGELYLWRNGGAANFTVEYPNVNTEVNYSDPLYVVAGDINGDGWKDLIGWPAREAYAGAWILMRSSHGTTFGAPFLQGVQPAVLNDIDADGDADSIGRAAGNIVNNSISLSRSIDGEDVGARRQFGAASPGSDGCVPVLGATGPFRVGEEMQLRIRGGPGGALGYLAVGVTEALIDNTPFPGMTSYVAAPHRNLPIKLDGPLGVPCIGTRTRQFVVPPGFAGHTWFHQVFLHDSGAPNGLSSSNALQLSYD